MLERMSIMKQGNCLGVVSVAQIPQSGSRITIQIAKGDGASVVGNARNTARGGPGNLSGNTQVGPLQKARNGRTGSTH